MSDSFIEAKARMLDSYEQLVQHWPAEARLMGLANSVPQEQAKSTLVYVPRDAPEPAMSDDTRHWLIIACTLITLAVLWGTFATAYAFVQAQSAERVAHEKTVQNCLWQHRTPAECGVTR